MLVFGIAFCPTPMRLTLEPRSAMPEKSASPMT
jgi:hypothetical protein